MAKIEKLWQITSWRNVLCINGYGQMRYEREKRGMGEWER